MIFFLKVTLYLFVPEATFITEWNLPYSVYLGRVNIQIYLGRNPIYLRLLHAFKLTAEANLGEDLGNEREGQEYWIWDLEKTVLSQLKIWLTVMTWIYPFGLSDISQWNWDEQELEISPASLPKRLSNLQQRCVLQVSGQTYYRCSQRAMATRPFGPKLMFTRPITIYL